MCTRIFIIVNVPPRPYKTLTIDGALRGRLVAREAAMAASGSVSLARKAAGAKAAARAEALPGKEQEVFQKLTRQTYYNYTTTN